MTFRMADAEKDGNGQSLSARLRAPLIAADGLYRNPLTANRRQQPGELLDSEKIASPPGMLASQNGVAALLKVAADCSHRCQDGVSRHQHTVGSLLVAANRSA
jgi:hypothetical protein